MVHLNILLPDHMKIAAEDQASKMGYPSIDAYVASLIVADVAERFPSPNHLAFQSQQQLSALLKEGETSPAREMTADDWNQIRARLTAIRKDSKAE